MDLNEIGNGIRDYQFNTKGDQTLRIGQNFTRCGLGWLPTSWLPTMANSTFM